MKFAADDADALSAGEAGVRAVSGAGGLRTVQVVGGPSVASRLSGQSKLGVGGFRRLLRYEMRVRLCAPQPPAPAEGDISAGLQQFSGGFVAGPRNGRYNPGFRAFEIRA